MKSLVDKVTGEFIYLTLKSSAGEYKVMLNPETYSEDYEINYTPQKGVASSNATPLFNHAEPGTISFDILIDGTGVINSKRTKVAKEIKDFKKIAIKYQGKDHAPPIVTLKWGAGLSFKGVVKSLKLNYTLFCHEGKPLRAKASVSFVHYMAPKKIKKEEGSNSPDMTHRIVVKHGDNLPQLCEQIYGSSKYLAQVARHNRLYNFRALSSGTTLFFPPLH